MLVLTRKAKQQIQIGENVVITILQVRGQAVRVGIEAPRAVRVVRAEIADLPADKPEYGKATARHLVRGDSEALSAGKGFKSPVAGCTGLTGESSGLRPLLVRRAVGRRAVVDKLTAKES